MGTRRGSASAAVPASAQHDGGGHLGSGGVAQHDGGGTQIASSTTAPVFVYDDGAALAALMPGDIVELTGAEGKHAQVQRLQPGEAADVVDGRGLRLRCRVVEPIAGGLRLEVSSVAPEPAPPVNIVLVQALAKSDRDELAIATAVEVGVDQVLPWQADRSIVIWRADKAAKAKQRWVDAVRAAAKQARRAWIPLVQDAVNSKQLATRIAAVTQAGGTAWVLDAGGTVTAATADLPALSHSAASAEPGLPANAGTQNLTANPPELLIIVGPEGGISGSELAAFQQAGAQLVRLGPHIMRTSTAGPIAVALAAERMGRWEV